jgi:hypothetical protein
MQSSTSVAVEVEPERESEVVLVTGRLIEPGELFWPEDSAMHLLADSWQVVDPLEDDSDAVSHMVINPESGDIAQKAEQALIQLDFNPQPAGMLQRAEFFMGTIEVFGGDLPMLATLLKQHEGLGGNFALILLYEVAHIEEGHLLEKEIKGWLPASTLPYIPIVELPQLLALVDAE